MRKRNLQLAKSESLLAIFDLRNDSKHFLDGSDETEIVVTGLLKDVLLGFRLSLGQFQAMNLH